MTRANVDPGICGLKATIEVKKTGKMSVKVEIRSECEKVANLGTSISTLILHDVMKPFNTCEVYKLASGHHLCISCPIPSSILKAIEIEMGLALPKPVHVQFQNIE